MHGQTFFICLVLKLYFFFREVKLCTECHIKDQFFLSISFERPSEFLLIFSCELCGRAVGLSLRPVTHNTCSGWVCVVVP